MEQKTKKKGVNQLINLVNPLFLLVPPAGIGPAAPGLGILCSIH